MREVKRLDTGIRDEKLNERKDLLNPNIALHMENEKH